MRYVNNLFYKIALFIGVAMIIVGIVFIFWDSSHSGLDGSGLARASTSIEFGADYYTISAQYSGLAANALCDIFKLLKFAFATFFVLIGGLDICFCLIKILPAKKQAVDEYSATQSIAVDGTTQK